MNDPQNSSSTWFGHPPQLFRLFITEMWERFGYYGMRAILTSTLPPSSSTATKSLGSLRCLYIACLPDTFVWWNVGRQHFGFQAIGEVWRHLDVDRLLWTLFWRCQSHSVCYARWQAIRNQRSGQTDAETSATKKVQQFVMDDGDYFFKGQKDGSLIATKASDESVTKTLPKGKFYFSAERSEFYVQLMFLSLACIIIGNGFFKPNISTMVGSLYSQGDTRRDSGFTIFYMGINMGALLSQALCPFVAQEYGFWAGFLLAAIGMMVAYFLFQFDGGSLKGYGEPPSADSMSRSLIVMVGAILFIPLMWYFMNNTMLVEEAKALASQRRSDDRRSRNQAVCTSDDRQLLNGLAHSWKDPFRPLPGCNDRDADLGVVRGNPRRTAQDVRGYRTDCVLGRLLDIVRTSGLLLDAVCRPQYRSKYFRLGDDRRSGTALQCSLYRCPGAGLLLALDDAGQTKHGAFDSGQVRSFLVLIGVGFLSLKLGAGFADSQFRVGIIWLILMYLFHTIAELCLSPVGLSMITKLSMVRVVGLMMGVWFLSTSMAQYVGGLIAQFASVETVGGEVLDPKIALDTYIGVFTQIAYVSIGIGIVLLVISPLLKKMMHGVR